MEIIERATILKKFTRRIINATKHANFIHFSIHPQFGRKSLQTDRVPLLHPSPDLNRINVAHRLLPIY